MDCETGAILFASSMIFELHEEEGEHFVRARYNGKYMHLCGSVDGKCPYEEFKERLMPMIAFDMEKLTGVRFEKFSKKPSYDG